MSKLLKIIYINEKVFSTLAKDSDSEGNRTNSKITVTEWNEDTVEVNACGMDLYEAKVENDLFLFACSF